VPQVIDAIPDRRPEGVLREGVDVYDDRLLTPDLTGLVGLADEALSSWCSSPSANAWTSQRGDQAERFRDEHEETVDVGVVGALGVQLPSSSQRSTSCWSAKL
jgi:hypothetical protein